MSCSRYAAGLGYTKAPISLSISLFFRFTPCTNQKSVFWMNFCITDLAELSGVQDIYCFKCIVWSMHISVSVSASYLVRQNHVNNLWQILCVLEPQPLYNIRLSWHNQSHLLGYHNNCQVLKYKQQISEHQSFRQRYPCEVLPSTEWIRYEKRWSSVQVGFNSCRNTWEFSLKSSSTSKYSEKRDWTIVRACPSLPPSYDLARDTSGSTTLSTDNLSFSGMLAKWFCSSQLKNTHFTLNHQV